MSCALAALPLANYAVSRSRQLHLGCFRWKSKSYCISSKSLPKNAFGLLQNDCGGIMCAKEMRHPPLTRAHWMEDGVSQSQLDEGKSSLDGCEPTEHSTKEATLDLKLPRRSLLVQFTCNACGERTQRTINRVAYERGTIFLQCAGCQQYHKFVDNLGLVVEYDFRTEGTLEEEDD